MSLTTRHPRPQPADLVKGLVPPPRFAHARLDNYVPDPGHPSQEHAVQAARRFIEGARTPAASGPFRFLRKKKAAARGLYFDGGYGVGKTHLLTAIFHELPGAAYGTFVEYTNLVGVLGYASAIEHFAQVSAVLIDEFELDDVGDTLLMTRLIRELSDRGVSIAATSNTLPDALGEGRFASQDFLREIHQMAERFDVERIDGEDYRRRSLAAFSSRLSDADVEHAAARVEGASLDTWPALLDHLTAVHPSSYGALVDGIRLAALTGVTTLDDHRDALRFVVLVDRLYDRRIPVLYSGVSLETLFTEDLLKSGYTKKYRRCLSRLTALAAEGAHCATDTASAPGSPV